MTSSQDAMTQDQDALTFDVADRQPVAADAALSDMTEAEELAAAEAEAAGEGAVDEAPKKKGLPEIPVATVAVLNGPEDWARVLIAHREWMEGVLDPKVEVARGRANLSGLDLTAYEMRHANLSGANLAGAMLAGCDLTGANLSAANLTNACLRAANLSGAKLRGARIDGADLRGADLTGANLSGLDLTRALTKSDEKTEVAGVAADTEVAAQSADEVSC